MKKFFYILLTSFCVLAGYFSINRLILKPDLPFEYTSKNSVIVLESFPGQPGVNYIESLDSYKINSAFQLEFLLDSKQAGDVVNLSMKDLSGKYISRNITLGSNYHDSIFIFVSGFIGYVFLLTALFVMLKKTESKQAALLYWILTLFGTATLTSPGKYYLNNDIIGYIIRTSHAVSYAAGGLCFVLFILAFPLDKLKNRKTSIIILSVLTCISILFAALTQIAAINNINAAALFDRSWDTVQLLLVISLLYGTFELVQTLRSLTKKVDKRKIEWIIWGLVTGVSPFLLLWVVPSIAGLSPPVKEEYLLAFLILVPFSFSIAVMKYHVLDIEFIIKRSVVYSALLVLITFIYWGIIYLTDLAAGEIIGGKLRLFNLLSVFIIAILFNPLRLRVISFIDVIFYRKKYIFDKAIDEITHKIKECVTIGNLGKILLEEIDRFVPVKAAAIVIISENGERVRILEQKNFDDLAVNIDALRVKKLNSEFNLPIALATKVENGIDIDTSMENVLKRWDINVVFPFMLESSEVLGAIVLGGKLSGLQYSNTDIELLNTIAFTAALVIKRIELQKKLVEEESEKLRLEELNQLKSYFVASVSHDLKTPLTSIKMFAELLQNKEITKEKASEYLHILEGETDRLNRLIDNVLDFAKIEKGDKEYDLKKTDLNVLVRDSVDLLNYELRMQEFRTETKYKENRLFIYADADGVKSAIMNLISNAVKYAGRCRQIRIFTESTEDTALVVVEDKGIGISENKLDEIFKPFFRGGVPGVKGAGLGLSIVKHVMDAHKGKTEVQSVPGEGSIFKLIFPLYKDEK